MVPADLVEGEMGLADVVSQVPESGPGAPIFVLDLGLGTWATRPAHRPDDCLILSGRHAKICLARWFMRGVEVY